VPSGTAYNQDQYGQHWYVFFSGCAACNLLTVAATGADTIAIVNNTFVDSVYLQPFCLGSGSSITEVWLNNQSKTSSGQACTLGAAGCAFFVGSCQQPPLVPPATMVMANIIQAIVTN
jgi:hypothetical protein